MEGNSIEASVLARWSQLQHNYHLWRGDRSGNSFHHLERRPAPTSRHTRVPRCLNGIFIMRQSNSKPVGAMYSHTCGQTAVRRPERYPPQLRKDPRHVVPFKEEERLLTIPQRSPWDCLDTVTKSFSVRMQLRHRFRRLYIFYWA